MREFAFEVRLCAHLETVTEGVLARQIGGGVHRGGRRILDIVHVAPGPAFAERVAITPRTIPPRAIHSDVGVTDATHGPGSLDLPPDRARAVIDEAVAAGFFERLPMGDGEYVRRTTRYPDWIGPITAIENKPDLGAPGDLREQLRFDVALGLVDRVILATRSYVTGAHLNRLPEEVGVWRVRQAADTLDVEEVRPPTPLASADWGIELGQRMPTGWRMRSVSPAAKRQARIRLAEHVYGRGWRVGFPGCQAVSARSTSGTPALPYCAYYDQVVDPGGCGPSCSGFTPAEPPPIDVAAERETRTGWRANPPGVPRRQTGLDRFDPKASADPPPEDRASDRGEQ